MLKSNRAGFTLAEAMVALALTAAIGAAVTGVFVSQSRFFDHQEKVGFARSVSRGALNMMLSELRMLERTGGMVSATNKRITVRVPYMLGLVCGNDAGDFTVFSGLPADKSILADSAFSGYAYRTTAGSYVYVEGSGTDMPVTDNAAPTCADASITTLPASINGQVVKIKPKVPAAVGAGSPIFLYQIISYEFRESALVPGRTGLWRRMHKRDVMEEVEEELIAPFDTTAKFRFYVNDAATAQTAVPDALSTLTGFEITLDGLSERPNTDGSHQMVPLTSSVFFKNR